MSHMLKAVAPAVISAVMLGGCATKEYVDQRVGALETRVAAVDRTAQDALARATAAQKLAEGKFVYSVVLSDDSVKFPFAKADLSPEAETKLSELAKKLISDNKNVYLEIQGYTDDVGTPARNLRLAQARADAAMMYLYRQGIAANRMATISYGEDQPIAPNNTPEGRAKNRRITVVVLN